MNAITANVITLIVLCTLLVSIFAVMVSIYAINNVKKPKSPFAFTTWTLGHQSEEAAVRELNESYTQIQNFIEQNGQNTIQFEAHLVDELTGCEKKIAEPVQDVQTINKFQL
ncbi:MAG: hypothetical protein Q7R33_07495 [Nitrosarchaeum sp.]|nr:hypothetical protein [Nitrosarchaeum sp.]